MFLGSIVRWVRRADNLTAIYEPILYIMLDPEHLKTLYASKARYGDSFTTFSLKPGWLRQSAHS
jgi:hypothetical protein